MCCTEDKGEIFERAKAFADKYEIYNAHCHIYPEKIAEKAVVNIGKFYDIPMDVIAGTAEGLIADGAPFGVKKSLVCSAATDASQVESVNSFIMSECAKHPELLGFGTLHPDYEGGFDKEIDRCIEGGLRGIKLHSDFQKFNIDDERAFGIYEAAQGKLPILFHMGDPRYDYSKPERLARVLDRFPRLEAIAAHLGGYTAWEDAQRYLAGRPNLWYDSSSSLFLLSPEKATEYIKKLGVDRVFYGTDFPMWDMAGELERFEKLALDDDERKAVLSENFKRCFGIE